MTHHQPPSFDVVPGATRRGRPVRVLTFSKKLAHLVTTVGVVAVVGGVGGVGGCADPLPEFQPHPEPPPRYSDDVPPLDETPPSSSPSTPGRGMGGTLGEGGTLH